MAPSPHQSNERSSSRRETVMFAVVLYGTLAACLIFEILFRLIAWQGIQIIIQVTIVAILVGVICSILSEYFIGRRKSFWSNLVGIVLVVMAIACTSLLPREWTLAVYYDTDAPQLSSWASGLGTTIFLFSLGGAFRLGSYVARQLQTSWQRKQSSRQHTD